MTEFIFPICKLNPNNDNNKKNRHGFPLLSKNRRKQT